MIVVKKLSKNFGRIKAVSNVNFSLKRGEIVTLLGPNGAGKTTLMRLISGYIEPTAGSVSILEHDIREERFQALTHIGYVPENSPAYGDMTVFEYFNFIAKLRRLDDFAFAERYADITRRFGLAAVVNQRIETLSKGFRHRTAIAAALLNKPQILILDEPTEGLDPNQKHEFREFLKDYGKSNLVVVSTHIMEEVEALATRVIMMNKGKIIKDTTAFDLKNFAQSGNMEDAFRRIINQ